MKKRYIIFLIILFYSAGFLRITQAQTEPPIAPPQLEISKQQYIQSLDVYREKEQKFLISREQYNQLQTLASLEEVVRTSKDVQLARMDTLTAYFNTLLLSIQNLKGAEITKKANQGQLLQTALVEIERQRNTILTSNDRVTLDKTSANYDDKQGAFSSIAYSSLALIKISNIQSATDQLGVLTGEVYTSIQESSPSATIFAEKQRGYDELARTIETIKMSTKKATQQYDNISGRDLFTQGAYAQIVETLGTGYAKLKQGESFIQELAQ
ncbi:MAG: hypothetical protein HZA34_02370 [Candidatus Pacebacteria bacterium]|nr:hypothetical protein [Candidatus Paceibacterota bacterium]